VTETVVRTRWAGGTRFLKRNLSLFVLLAVLAGIAYLYYGIPRGERNNLSDVMERWKGGSDRGIFLAFAGTLLLVVAQAYTLVKRVGLPLVMRAVGGPGLWLNIHIALSVIGFVAVLVHAGFPYDFRYTRLTQNAYAGLATWLLLVATISGVFGRYLYRRLPLGKSVFGFWKQTHTVVTVLLFVFVILHITGAET